MRILAIDIGTGTQDILLFDSDHEIENCVQLVLPSPTVIVAESIRRATASGDRVLLTGDIMGGGPSSWAARDHILAGYELFATEQAARTFDDDLDQVRAMGVQIVGEHDIVSHAVTIPLGDFQQDAILAVLDRFGVARPEAVAIAAFDHGDAPPGYSDRRFRFDFLISRIDLGLAAFAFLGSEIPASLTRLQAVARSAATFHQVLVMDTGPAAVLGALDDPLVRALRPSIVANLGNFHTLAFALDESGIAGLFEHHTGELKRVQLEEFLDRLASGELTNAEIFDSQGHGAIVQRSLGSSPGAGLRLAVTGPRRGLLAGSRFSPYLAVPHGDMMLTGCFGLLRAWSAKDPGVAELVKGRLGPGVAGSA